ncbi:cGMP-specific phosphodiesterase [Tieghemostelium lacteum]|uniref:cGMP-specific phosphodiesterase n=1 Tax=Tieghemostelium lacteum TaxID=361077 RepID=A0A151Z5M0_TIELA|nr:cGMP-specific phosphodiesterase [Tieghemostelium lacteum]|eukprot:KYQ89235.1 cGMP-specific phosphodiesterase [Tieghemostelium lacteum]
MEFLKSWARALKFNKSPTKKKPEENENENNNISNNNETNQNIKPSQTQTTNENTNNSTDVNKTSTTTTSTTTIQINSNQNGASTDSINSSSSGSSISNSDIKVNKDELFSIDFSSFSKNKKELIECSLIIFEETGITKHLDIDRAIMERYLYRVKEAYRDNPFHSFNHAVTVTQMIFLIIIKTQLLNILTPMEKLAILIASVCHDLDHPGLNNRFQINIKSELAQLYNNKSVLENHHLQQCLQTLHEQSGKDLLSKLSETEREILYDQVKVLILATDMENHFMYKEKFDQIIPVFDWQNKDHRELLLIMLLKSADISNELRSWEVSSKWANALMQEFFNQSDLEKENNLPLTPFMVREKVVLNSTQVSFIDKFLLPTYQALQNILPPLSVFIERINQNRQVWEAVQS